MKTLYIIEDSNCSMHACVSLDTHRHYTQMHTCPLTPPCGCVRLRLQRGLVGSGGADVRDDGREVTLRHRGELGQPRPEHGRLPLPR